MEPTANIIEIFSSIQGEGPYAGERHLFVRFEGCELSCQFCDTPASFIHNPTCRVEEMPFTKKFAYYPNPLTPSQINQLLGNFNGEKVLSVTGGEPLQQVDFLKAWLPTVKKRYPILLETAGVHYKELKAILPYVDIISMDLKLPSVTGMRAYWKEHREFMKRGHSHNLYVKVVVSAKSTAEDVDTAINLIAEVDPEIPFIFQAASPFATFRSQPKPEQLEHWVDLAQRQLKDVRVIPQLHKSLKVL